MKMGHMGDMAFLPEKKKTKKKQYHQVTWMIRLFCTEQKKYITTFGAHGGRAFDRIRYQIGKRQKEKCMINRL